MQCFFLTIRYCTIAILTLTPFDIGGSQFNALKVSHGPSSPPGGRDGIVHLTFDTFIFVNPLALWHPEMKLVICAIVVYRDVWVSASDPRFLKLHFRGQIVKKNSIPNTRYIHADHHSGGWVHHLLDLKLHSSKSVFIHPLWVALQ
jgi:hypothetical protein